MLVISLHITIEHYRATIYSINTPRFFDYYANNYQFFSISPKHFILNRVNIQPIIMTVTMLIIYRSIIAKHTDRSNEESHLVIGVLG